MLLYAQGGIYIYNIAAARAVDRELYREHIGNIYRDIYREYIRNIYRDI